MDAQRVGNRMVPLIKWWSTLFMVLVCWLAVSGVSSAETISLQWAPSTASDVAGYRVYYKADSATPPLNGTGATQGPSPLNVGNNTTASISGLDPSHTYYFAVTALNSSGVESSYSNIVIIPEHVPPTVAISSPANGASVSGAVSVGISASDNVGVTRVELYANGQLQGSATANPSQISWDTGSLSSGTYTLIAKAYDAASNVGQSAPVSVTLVKDTTAPTVSVTAPANGATLSGTVSVTSNSSDNIGVTKLEYYVNNTLMWAGNVPPFTFNWDTTTMSNGSYLLTAKGYDASGNVGQSATVSVNVSNSTGATGGTLPINVASQANGGVASASSTYNANYAVSGVDDGDRIGAKWGTGGGWNDATAGAYPDWVQITFSRQQVIGEVDVFTLQDSFNPVEPTPTMTFNYFGITAFDVQYWNGVGWVTVPGGSISGNNLVWRKVSFPPLTTDRIRVQVNASLQDYSRIVEIEAYTVPGDSIAPTVTAFSMPASSTSLNVPVSAFTATDNSVVTGYLITESATAPAASDPGWTQSAPVSFTFGAAGSRTAYAWVKDAAGNVSAGATAGVVIDILPPVISITAPASGGTVSGSVNVTMTASDDVGVARVELYLNGILQGSYSAAPYTLSWNTTTAANGPSTLIAKAYDVAGNVGQSQSVVVNVFNDTTAPVPTIASPVSGATVGGLVSVSATASDNVAVTKVEFYVNGVLQGTAGAAPYLFSWSTAPLTSGSYTLAVKAYDAAGNVGQASEVVNVFNDTIAPVAAISSPSPGSTVGGNVSVAASATDNVGVTKVELYVNGSLLATDAASPYLFNWNTAGLANGAYTLAVKAYDAAGNVGQSSQVVNVFNDTVAPTAGIVSPTSGSTLSGLVSVSATGGDNIAVTRVELYANGTLLATDSGSPYVFNWDTTATGNGSYTLVVKAYDAAGNVGTSTGVTVSILNQRGNKKK